MVYKGREKLKEEALRLRKEEGLGYHSIAKRLGNVVHWSTIRNWTQEVPVVPGEAYQIALEAAKKERWPTRKEAVRKRLLEERGHRCETCGLTEWRGQPITLEMHRLLAGGKYIRENVALLCPNCHAQTDSWRNKSHA